MHLAHLHISRGAAALAAAMGIGRFVYTPIVPVMASQAGLGTFGAGALATANYVGYFAGAVAASAAPRMIRTVPVWRTALILNVVGLTLMPLAHDVTVWAATRAVTGFAGAVLFVIAVDWILNHSGGRSDRLTGWGLGGVGVGIALSGALVLLLPTAQWRTLWWAAAAAAAVISAVAWPMRGAGDPAASPPRTTSGLRRWFLVLLACYSLEGVGYIIAGTFLVAAIGQASGGPFGNAAWLVVGLAAAPSAALWAAASARWSRPALLTSALLVQAGGIALPAFVNGAVSAVAGAMAFGGTFIGVSTLALAAGRELAIPGAVAVLTAGYSLGQIVGPLLVIPLLHHGFRAALLASAAVIVGSATTAAWLSVGHRSVSPPRGGADRGREAISRTR